MTTLRYRAPRGMGRKFGLLLLGPDMVLPLRVVVLV